MTKVATYFTQPMCYYGTYRTNTWAGYVFKENLNNGTESKPWHTGVDYNGAGGGNADLGMEIRSIADGIVRWVGTRNDLGFGNMTIIEYPLSNALKKELGCDSLFARYMHQNTIEVTTDQEVMIGQRIGSVGNSGTQWAHLHLDLYKNTIEGGGVHFRYDKNTELQSYLDALPFIQSHNTSPVSDAKLQGFQRRVSNPDGVNGRSAPNTAASIVKEFTQGEVLDFKGFVVGQDPYGNGNLIWFVGRYSDTYWYSGAFEDKDTHDLPNLTPQETPTPNNPSTPSVPNARPVTEVVNKKHPINPLHYVPTDLTSVGGQLLRTEAANSLLIMKMAAEKANVTLVPQSGYRSYDAQNNLYKQYVAVDGQAKADTYSARPGFSEHQTGLTMDFAPIDDSFKNFAAYKFLTENGYKYGWILRYPADKEAVTGYMSEPWHWRYVGVDVATDMHNKGITTLEEYYGIEGGGYVDTPMPKDDEPETPVETDPPRPIPADTPIPATLNEYVTSIIRTAVPYLVGLASSIAVTHKLALPAGTLELLTALLTFLFGTGWYIVWRWLETKFPQLGWFLGKASQPIYPKEEK